MALPGRVPGSAVADHQAPVAVGSPPAQGRVGGPPGLGVPVAESPGHRLPVAGFIRPVPGQGAGRVRRGVRVRAVGPGPAARLEGHHERQPGLRELAAEPVLVAVGAVRGHRPEREPRRPGPERQVRADRQLGPEPRIVLPLREVPRRGVRHRVHRIVQPLIGPHRGDGDHPVVGLAVPAQPLMAHVRGLHPVLAVPAVIDHQHPRIVRGGRRIRPQQLQPAGIDPLRVPPGLGEEELQPLHRRCCAPATGSAPASAVSVLFRSRGASSPARYSRNPRRCAKRAEQVIKPRRVLLQRARRRRTGPTSPSSRTPQQVMPLLPGIPPTRSRVNKPPLTRLNS